MNNNMYTPNFIPNQSTAPPSIPQNSNYNNQNYANDILQNNIGKKVKLYVSFSDSIEWRDSVFEGNIEEVGKDYIIIYDKENENRYMIWNVYLNYIVFNEQVNRGY